MQLTKSLNGECAYADTAKPFKHDLSGAGRRRWGVQVPDQTIREIRALHQYRCWTRKRLEAEYGLTTKQIDSIVLGVTGAYLVFSEADLPKS
ncbi:hypothetical protein D3C75_1270310 [compost metagenome]